MTIITMPEPVMSLAVAPKTREASAYSENSPDQIYENNFPLFTANLSHSSLLLHRYAMTSITVPEPVMSLAVAPKTREASGAFSKALNRFTKEDPTFRVGLDPESGQTIISGMGELHLDIYIERMKREYKVHHASLLASGYSKSPCGA